MMDDTDRRFVLAGVRILAGGILDPEEFDQDTGRILRGFLSWPSNKELVSFADVFAMLSNGSAPIESSGVIGTDKLSCLSGVVGRVG